MNFDSAHGQWHDIYIHIFKLLDNATNNLWILELDFKIVDMPYNILLASLYLLVHHIQVVYISFKPEFVYQYMRNIIIT